MNIVTVANLCIALVMYQDCPVAPPPPALADLPILVTWYNPALGGINCNNDCSTLADGTKWNDSHYNNTAACIVRLRGATLHFGDYAVKCRDSGGMVKISWNDYYQRWVMHVDVLSAEPIGCNYCLYEKWRVKWGG